MLPRKLHRVSAGIFQVTLRDVIKWVSQPRFGPNEQMRFTEVTGG